MASFEHTVVINRPVEAVFNFLMAAESNLEWQPSLVDATAVSPGPVRVGWRFRERRCVLGRMIETEFEVAEYDPPLFCRIRALTGMSTLRASYRLQPAGRATILTATGEIPDGAHGRLATCVVIRAVGHEIQSNLQRLAAVMEQTPAPWSVAG